MTGYLYWSDIGRKNKIERSTLAGEGRTVLLDENSFGLIGRPTALTIDHQDNILYWLDNSDSYIVSFDLNDERAYPRDLKQVVTSGDLFSFDIDPEFGFFVTDRQDNNLHIVPLDLRKATQTIFWQHEVPHGIIFHSDINQPKESALCEGAGCDQLCASDPAGYRCFCTYGYQLNNDEKTYEPGNRFIIIDYITVFFQLKKSEELPTLR
ncbi:low-density lipoprotein receptor-related protein 8-like [Ptychodera flava]|uniref:low-density lipoprotein receptor-related protein 8-like n=1 Tax=Ptychodera flava TaxID=63121 RepID=UPI003969C390